MTSGAQVPSAYRAVMSNESLSAVAQRQQVDLRALLAHVHPEVVVDDHPVGVVGGDHRAVGVLAGEHRLLVR